MVYSTLLAFIGSEAGENKDGREEQASLGNSAGIFTTGKKTGLRSNLPSYYHRM